MQIKGKQLDNLKCDFCAELLSYSPILINDDGENMCGRCIDLEEKSDKIFVWNKVYEEIAAYVQFPCIYNKNGCKAMVQLENSKYHEENCSYRNKNKTNLKEFICPFSKTNQCPWSGQQNEFEFHCRNEHARSIINHPFCHKPYINKSTENYYITTYFDYLFLLDVRCILPMNTIGYNVQFMGPSNLAHLFEYNLTFKNGMSVIQEKEMVLPYNLNVDFETTGISNKITNLINLLGAYDEIKFELRINMRKTPCIRCNNDIKTAPLYPSDEEGKYFCMTCNEIMSLFEINPVDLNEPQFSKTKLGESSKTAKNVIEKKDRTDKIDGMKWEEVAEKIIQGFIENLNAPGPSGARNTQLQEFSACSNSHYGCQFITCDDKILDRHENWLCTFGELCLLCFEEYDSETRIQHLENHHADSSRSAITLPHTNNAISKIFTSVQALDIEDCQVAIRNCHGKTFFAVFEFSSDSNILFLTSDDERENITYTFKYRIVSKNNEFQHFGDLDRVKK